MKSAGRQLLLGIRERLRCLPPGHVIRSMAVSGGGLSGWPHARDVGRDGYVRLDLAPAASSGEKEASAGVAVLGHQRQVDDRVREGGQRHEHLLDHVRGGGELGRVVRARHFLFFFVFFFRSAER